MITIDRVLRLTIMIHQKQIAIITTMALFLLSSCSTARLVRKTFTGQQISFVKKKLGQPIYNSEISGDSLYVFQRSEQLNSTEIGQGKMTLDPIVSPKVIKKERFYFTVRDGIVVKTDYEEEYER